MARTPEITPIKLRKQKDDFDVTSIVETHSNDITGLQKSFVTLEAKIGDSIKFGKTFSKSLTESRELANDLERFVESHLRAKKDSTKKILSQIFDEINKENTFLKLGKFGQVLLTLLVAAASAFFGATITRLLQ